MKKQSSGLQRVVEAAAARYAARCWWADVKDLEQEAWTVALEAQKHYDPAKAAGAPLEAYVWRAVVIQLSIYLRKQSAPVSASSNYVKDLEGLHRAPLTKVRNEPTMDTEVDADVHQERWRKAVRDRVTWLVMKSVRDGHKGVQAGVESLTDVPNANSSYEKLDEAVKPGEVAKRRAKAPESVYNAKSKAKELLESDPILRALNKDR